MERRGAAAPALDSTAAGDVDDVIVGGHRRRFHEAGVDVPPSLVEEEVHGVRVAVLRREVERGDPTVARVMIGRRR